MNHFKMILAFTLGMLIASTPALSYTEPPYIPVNKPIPVQTKTVCASGCDYNSLSAANAVASSGWLLKIKAGNYNSLTWSASGTLDNEIVIEAFGDGDVIINVSKGNRFYIAASYVIFDGGLNQQLIFDGYNLDNGQLMISPRSGVQGLTFSRVQMRNACKILTLKSVACSLIDVGGGNTKIYNSHLYNSNSVGMYGVWGDNHEIKNNIIHDNKGTGVQYNPHGSKSGAQDSVDNLVISGNLIYNNGSGGKSGPRPGISLLSNDNTLYNVYVFNNFLWGNIESGVKLESGISKSTINVYNNTVHDNVNKGFWFKDSGGTVSVKNNIVFNNGASVDANWIPASWGSNTGPDCSLCSNNITSVEPLFISTTESNSDFLKLSSSSAAIDAGVDLSGSGVLDDIYGNARPQYTGYDIGAHEYTVDSNLFISSMLNGSFVNASDSYKSYPITVKGAVSGDSVVIKAGTIPIGTATSDSVVSFTQNVDFTTAGVTEGPISLTVESNGKTSPVVSITFDKTPPPKITGLQIK